MLRGNATFVGLDLLGRATEYDALLSRAPGMPLDLVDAAPTGQVVVLLPEGEWGLSPSMRVVNPGGGSSILTLPGFVVTVGCRQIVDARPEIQLSLDSSAPPCAATETVRVSGTVTSEAEIALIAWSVNGGSETEHCAPCGLAPSFEIDVALPADTNLIRVRAETVEGHDASVTTRTRFAYEPSALDQRPGAAPLLIARSGPSRLALAWERVPDAESSLSHGTLASLWEERTSDHGREGACDLTAGGAELSVPAEDSCYLVTSRCGGGAAESSPGRDSRGLERPAAVDPCP